MGKLQKPHQNLRRQPPESSCVASKTPTSSSLRPKVEGSGDHILADIPKLRQQISNTASLTADSAQREARVSSSKAFEHRPTPIEPPFVVLGRERFLRKTKEAIRDGVPAAKFPVHRQEANSPLATADTAQLADGTPSAQSFSKTGAEQKPLGRSYPGTVAIDPRSLLGLVHPALRSPSQALAIAKAGNPSEVLKNTVLRQVARKRSQSLPTMREMTNTMARMSSRSSLSIKDATAEDRSTESATKDVPPFTPRIDIDTVFKDISSSYNEKLEKAQHKSMVIWSREIDHRTLCREAGVLKKKGRRVSSPATTALLPSATFDEAQSSSKLSLRNSLKVEPHSYNTTGIPIKLHDAESASFSKGIFDTAASQDAVSVTSTIAPACLTCPHCGQSTSSNNTTKALQTVENDGTSRLSPYNLDSATQVKDQPQGLPTTGQQSHCYPCTPVEVSVSERLEAARKTLLATTNRSSIGIVSSTTEVSSEQRITNEVANTSTLNNTTMVDDGDLPSVISNAMFQNLSLNQGQRRGSTGVNSLGNQADWHLRSNVVGNGSQIHAMEIMPSMDSSASSHSPSSSVSSSVFQYSSVANSRSRLSVALSTSKDSVAPHVRTSSSSPNRGVLTMSADIVSKPMNSSPFSSTSSLAKIATDSPSIKPRSRSRSQGLGALPQPTEYALNISRSSRGHSLSRSITRDEKQDDRQETPSSGNSPSRVFGAPLSPRAGTQSLSQFQSNCKPIPRIDQNHCNYEETNSKLVIVSSTSPPSVSALRRRSRPDALQLRQESSKKDDESHEEKPRGRAKYRSYKIPAVPQADSPGQIEGHLEAEKSLLTTLPDNKMVAHAARKSSNVSQRRDISRQSRPSMPPNSFPVSKKGEPGNGRSRSRSSSRIRSFLQSVGLVNKDSLDIDRKATSDDDQTSYLDRLAQLNADSPTGIDSTDSFRSSGPYECIPAQEARQRRKLVRKRAIEKTSTVATSKGKE